MKVSTTIQVTLELTVEEVKWLNGIMQNPFSQDHNPHYEDLYDKQMREVFFVATKIEDLGHGS